MCRRWRSSTGSLTDWWDRDGPVASSDSDWRPRASVARSAMGTSPLPETPPAYAPFDSGQLPANVSDYKPGWYPQTQVPDFVTPWPEVCCGARTRPVPACSSYSLRPLSRTLKPATL